MIQTLFFQPGKCTTVLHERLLKSDEKNKTFRFQATKTDPFLLLFLGTMLN